MSRTGLRTISSDDSPGPAVTVPGALTALNSYAIASAPVTAGGLYRLTDNQRGLGTGNGVNAHPVLPIINAADFGLSTSATDAENAANLNIATARAATLGLPVYLPAGIFEYDDTLLVGTNVSLIGCGWNLTGSELSKLRYTGNGVAIQLTGSGAKVLNVGLRGDESGGTGTVGIDLNGKLYYEIAGCYIRGFSSYGIDAEDSYLGTIERNHLSGNGVHLRYTLGGGNFFIKNNFGTSTSYAIIGQPAGGSSVSAVGIANVFTNAIGGAYAVKLYTGATGWSFHEGDHECSTSAGFLDVDSGADDGRVFGGTYQGASSLAMATTLNNINGDGWKIHPDKLYHSTNGIILNAGASQAFIGPFNVTNVTNPVVNNSTYPETHSIIGINGELENGSHMFRELQAAPADPTADVKARMYMRGDKLVIQFNNGGTVRYLTLDLTQGTGAAVWASNTVAP